MSILFMLLFTHDASPIPPDGTEQLNAMASANEAHLTLLTDLLSQGELPRGVFPSLAYHIATLDNAALWHLMETLLTSQSIWPPPSSQGPSSSSTSSFPLLSLSRGKDLFIAIQNGIIARAEYTQSSHGSGWTARRKFRQTCQFMLQTISIDKAGHDMHPLAPVILASAMLHALRDLSSRSNSLVKESAAILTMAQETVISSWETAALFAKDSLTRDVVDRKLTYSTVIDY